MHRRLVSVPVRIVTTVEILTKRVMKVKLEKGAAGKGQEGDFQLLPTLPVRSNIAFDVDSFVRSWEVQNVVFIQSVQDRWKRNVNGSKPLWVSKLIKFYKGWSHVKAPPARSPLASSTATGLVRPTRSSCQETMTTKMGLWRLFQVVLQQISLGVW